MDAIYARQSVDKKDSLSIEGQIALCRRYAAPDALIFEDRGFSGKNTKRPAFTELMRAVEDRRVGRIVVYRLDRFSRSLADFSALWETLQKNGVAFQSVTEQFDTSGPMGRAMLHIVMTFAQLERETTAARVRDNYRHRVSLGAWPGGPAPYGFALVKSARGVQIAQPPEQFDGARAEAVLDIEQKIARLVDVLPFEEKKLAAAELIERIELEGESANVIWKA